MRRGNFGDDEKVDGRCWGKRWSGWSGETTGTVTQQDGEKMGYRWQGREVDVIEGTPRDVYYMHSVMVGAKKVLRRNSQRKVRTGKEGGTNKAVPETLRNPGISLWAAQG